MCIRDRRMAWREAEARTQQGVCRLSGESAPLNSEDPLPPEVEQSLRSVSYTHLRAHETLSDL
eukprot:2552368-Karenia_brevis.AAC.1